MMKKKIKNEKMNMAMLPMLLGLLKAKNQFCVRPEKAFKKFYSTDFWLLYSCFQLQRVLLFRSSVMDVE